MSIETREDAGGEAAGERWVRDWGQLLRLARQVAGLSLTELSARTGLSKGYLSKLESGHVSARNPSRATLAALSRELPSFRPLAHTLEPAAPSAGVVALADAAPPPLALAEADLDAPPMPILLGWRDLELLIALLTLDQAATTAPLTALTLARAVGRPRGEVVSTLDVLVARGLLLQRAPSRVGDAPTYRRAPAVELEMGLAQIGDALVLAGALLAQAPVQRRLTRKSVS